MAVYAEDTSEVSARFSDGRLKGLTHSLSRGAAHSWLEGNSVVQRSAALADPPSIERFVRGEDRLPTADGRGYNDLAARIPSLSNLLNGIDQAARDTGPEVTQVLVEAEDVERNVVVVTADALKAERRNLRYLTVHVIARRGALVATGSCTPAASGKGGKRLDPVLIGQTAARRAVIALDARPAPAGSMAVIVGPGRGTVLIHEACCHPLEGDEISRNSIYAGRIGHQIASDVVSITDDPTVPDGAGAYGFDDEGHKAERTPLVIDGQLRSVLAGSGPSQLLRHPATPNSRRASFRHLAIPRMSNTCVHAGDSAPEQIIAATSRGIYAEHVGGGEVVEATGEFVFRVLSGYLIEDGKVTDPVQQTTVRGLGYKVLRNIDMVGNDVQLAAARCGKFGQLIPVGVQGPTIRISSLHVGGSAS